MIRPLVFVLLSAPVLAYAYPVDGYPYTGIRRLELYRLALLGELKGPRHAPGQHLPIEAAIPRWKSGNAGSLPPEDAKFSEALTRLLDEEAKPLYSMLVLDLSNPQQPRLGQHNGDLETNVGSVGKVLVALAVFHQLAVLYPDDIEARERVLREARVIADSFSQWDHHVVPFFDVETRTRRFRRIQPGDEANLWEYLDWMLSPSSSAAASMVQKELIALARFGTRYPVAEEEKEAFFRNHGRAELGRIYEQVQVGAIRTAGLDPVRLRQGSFFTRHGKQRVASHGLSIATPAQLVHLLYRLEAGTLIDHWSSRELKRLLYMTQRRIRYASHPALNQAAVYFKSGSLYQCLPDSTTCGKYRGDKVNRLASVAIVESPAGQPRLHYLVAVMSNVLKVNSAVAHQTLAMRIHRLIESLHPEDEHDR